MISNVKHKPRLFVTLLFFGLALSFLWCIVENIIGVQTSNVGSSLPISTTTIFSGYVWLIGHGLHGAAIFIIPSLYWRRLHPYNEENGQLFGTDASFSDL